MLKVKVSIIFFGTQGWTLLFEIIPLRYVCHVLRLLLFNWLVSMGFIIRFKGASSPLTACAPARMRPTLDQPPEFLLFYFIYIIPFTFKYNYSFDQQKLLIQLSLILVFSFSNAGTKKIRATASRYPALDITLNFYKWPYFANPSYQALLSVSATFNRVL
jgi:hypothetical protein